MDDSTIPAVLAELIDLPAGCATPRSWTWPPRKQPP